MKNKKGFTLVELLAVIVILAVLVLLAVPSVIKMLDNTRKNAFKVEAENIIKAGKNAYSNNALNGITKKCYTLEELSDYVDKNFTGYSGSVYIDSETNTYKVWLSKEPYIINGSNTGNISVIELEQFNNASTTCQDITVLACTNYKYNLIVDAYEGKFSDDTETLKYEMLTDEVQEIEEPTREGYSFNGWKIINNPKSFNNETFTMGTENVVLIAKWTINSYNLVINANGGTWSGTSPQTLDIEQEISIATPSKANYIFKGWTISEPTSAFDLETGIFTMGSANTTLTAIWHTPFQHSLTLAGLSPNLILEEFLSDSTALETYTSNLSAMTYLTNNPDIVTYIKSSSRYDYTSAQHFMNTDVITTSQKYAAGLPLYISKNGKPTETLFGILARSGGNYDYNYFYYGASNIYFAADGTTIVVSNASLNLNNYDFMYFKGQAYANNGANNTTKFGINADAGGNGNFTTSTSITLSGGSTTVYQDFTRTLNISGYDSNYYLKFALTKTGAFMGGVNLTEISLY